MPAFVIVTHEKTRNAGALDEYKKLAPESFAEHPAKFHVIHGRHEVLEGPATEGIILLEFPSYEEAKSWYHSPAYQAASVHRHQGADYRFILADGGPPK